MCSPCCSRLMRSLTFSCVVFTIGEIIWQKIPAEPLKYQHKHAVDWYFIERISKACINFTHKERPTTEEVVAMIGNEPTASSVQIHLKNSQSTSLEEFDREVAWVVAKNGEFDAVNVVLQPDNDGTNECVFLSIKIANEIYRLFQEGRRDDNPCRTRHMQNLCSCYLFTMLDYVSAMLCSLLPMYQLCNIPHYIVQSMQNLC